MQSNIPVSAEEFFDFFELSRIQEWIEENDHKRIALQFPPNYLLTAPELLLELERRLGDGRQCFLLADTSYRSCCLDEIAAEHANCDSLVHFGDACLSPATGKIPTLFIFGHQRLDLEAFRENVEAKLPARDTFNSVLILFDSAYSSLEEEIESIVKTFLPSPTNIHVCKLLSKAAEVEESQRIRTILGRAFPTNDELQDAQNLPLLLFVGVRESPLLTLVQLTVPSLRRVLHYTPEQQSTSYAETAVTKMLMKRLYLVERVRDARTIGLVIGTTALEGCREAMARTRQLCRQANKKLYVFHIGKLNEAKLTNFGLEVDVFVMLSCPYGILLDDKKFYKPVVSMAEAEIALNPQKAAADGFDFGWTAEFQSLLKEKIRPPMEDEMADMSLTSGGIRTSGKSATIVGDEDKSKQLIEYSAGDYFAQRTWKGLEDGFVENQGTELREGRSGIASHYEGEPNVVVIDK